MFKGKTLLVTGGTGSFGNAVMRRFLDSDIGEAKNVAKDHPDIVARLQKHAEAMRADLGDKDATAPGVRTLGRVENPQPLIDSAGHVRPGFDGVAKKLP